MHDPSDANACAYTKSAAIHCLFVGWEGGEQKAPDSCDTLQVKVKRVSVFGSNCCLTLSSIVLARAPIRLLAGTIICSC